MALPVNPWVIWRVDRGLRRSLTKIKTIGVDEILTDKQAIKLSELLRTNLTTDRAYLMREDFQRFWEYRSPVWAGKFLDEWCLRAMRSRIEPMKKMARTLRKHKDLLLNWFHAHAEPIHVAGARHPGGVIGWHRAFR